ncbi:MAG: response regulator [Betaproteobacteria bacterium]|nr:response regulator [Betaproteobacteria bacterium]
MNVTDISRIANPVAEGERPLALVADDLVAYRQVVRGALEIAGYEVLEAANGLEAIELAMEYPVQLAVLDVNMPGGIDGFQVCARIKRDPVLRGTKVIMLTVRQEHQDYARAEMTAADDYIPKPFRIDQLVASARALAA